MEHKKISKNGSTLHYFIGGKQHQEAILFLHPAFGDHRCFDAQLDYFLAHFRVITIDLPGHGLSQSDTGQDKIDHSTAFIHSILERESINAVHLVGVSMGSLLAQHFVFLHPEKSLSLTILGGYDIHADNKEVMRAQLTQNIKVIFRALISMKWFRRYISKYTNYNEEARAKFYEYSKTFRLRSFKAMTGLGNILKPRENVTYSIPVMIMVGAHDIELAKKISGLHHKNIPLSKYYILPNAGHCANMDNPEAFNQVVNEFIQGKSTRI